MLLESLDDAHRMLPLNPRFGAALEFLRRTDLAGLAEGRHDIDGDEVFAIVARGPGRDPDEARLETHDRYIDIQYVIAGVDTMGWAPRAACAHRTEHLPDKDVDFWADRPEAWVAVGPGRMAVFFPHDAHLPMTGPGEIHKVIVKVAI